ncbi:sigma-70 family RNA polymerase sigma factor [Larkinella ripae]
MSKPFTPQQEAFFLEALVSHSRKAYNELYDRYARALLGIIYRIVLDEAVAEDLLQETFIKVWRHVHHHDPAKGRLFTWLAQVARNTALDYLKCSKNRRTIELEPPMGGVVCPNISLIGLEETAWKAVSPQYRPVVELVYFQGYTHQETAEQLVLPLGTVKTRARLALVEIKRAFAGEL